ncbi:MAG TPA: hypothetical protein VEE85_00720 [Candidatus Bathyarchaeia archaeon]|nr:hypothetical protein [Candidatus Bathyarchaeia archaeon]
MDAENTIAEIEWLKRIFALPDTRPLSVSEREAANRKHDDMYASNPWFRLWKRYGICTRTESGSSDPYPGSKFLD